MEFNSLDSGMDTDLHVSSSSQTYLLTAAKWSKFLAITGFVMMGLAIFMFLLVLVGVGGNAFRMGMAQAFGGASGTAFTAIIIFYILLMAMYFFPLYYLYKFATLVKQGVNSSTNSMIEEGFKNLKSFFKFFGVFTAIVLAFYGLIIVFAVIVGAVS